MVGDFVICLLAFFNIYIYIFIFYFKKKGVQKEVQKGGPEKGSTFSLHLFIIPHGKGLVRYLRTRCFRIRNLTRSLRSLVRFLIRQQLVRKYRLSALSTKYSLYIVIAIIVRAI